jgi:tight adherence protein C
MILLLVIAGISISAAILLASETLTATSRRRHAAVATVRRWSAANGDATVAPVRPARLDEALARIGAKLLTARLREKLPQRLAAAGLNGRISVEAYVTLRLGLVVSGVLVAFVVASNSALTVGPTGLAVLVTGYACFVVPGFVLSKRAAARRERVAQALPDALDLLAVTVAAGLGLYGAIARLVESTNGTLTDEFALVLTEVRVGESSERALKRMAERLDTPEVTSFVRSLVQSEQLGVSLGHTLRNLADDARRRRRSLAEENAAKAPVKMLFPAALFIFPALFVVILGPAVLELGKYL